MKKIYAIMIILILVLTVATPIFAAAEPIEVTSSARMVGEKIVVKVNMDANSKAVSGRFTVTYPDTVTYESWQNNNLFHGTAKCNAKRAGKFLVYFSGTDVVRSGGTVFSVTFVPKKTTGVIEFGVKCDELVARCGYMLVASNTQGCKYTFGVEPVSVTSSARMKNGKIVVTVSVAPNSNAASAKFTLTYSEYMTYDSWENKHLFEGMATPNEIKKGEFILSFVGVSNTTEGGEAFSVSFIPRIYRGSVSFGLRCDEMIMEDSTTKVPTDVSCCSYTMGSVNRYFVTFLDWDDTELVTIEVNEGNDANAPDDPERTDYLFSSWDGDFTNVMDDLRIKAIYFRIGDVNRDGVLNTGDAAAIMKYNVGEIEFDEFQIRLADFNGDGRVNTGDAVAIVNFCIGE